MKQSVSKAAETSFLWGGLRECSRNAESQLEAVMEHLVGRQGQPRGAQLHAMDLRDQKG